MRTAVIIAITPLPAAVLYLITRASPVISGYAAAEETVEAETIVVTPIPVQVVAVVEAAIWRNPCRTNSAAAVLWLRLAQLEEAPLSVNF